MRSYSLNIFFFPVIFVVFSGFPGRANLRKNDGALKGQRFAASQLSTCSTTESLPERPFQSMVHYSMFKAGRLTDCAHPAHCPVFTLREPPLEPLQLTCLLHGTLGTDTCMRHSAWPLALIMFLFGFGVPGVVASGPA